MRPLIKYARVFICQYWINISRHSVNKSGSLADFMFTFLNMSLLIAMSVFDSNILRSCILRTRSSSQCWVRLSLIIFSFNLLILPLKSFFSRCILFAIYQLQLFSFFLLKLLDNILKSYSPNLHFKWQSILTSFSRLENRDCKELIFFWTSA